VVLKGVTNLRKYFVIAAAVICLAIGSPVMHAQTDATGNSTSATPATGSGIEGKWHFVLDTPGGDREVDADFTVDKDGNVTGKWGPADVAGTYKDGKLALAFQFTSDEAGTTADMKITGKLDETAALAGDWEFSEYNGTFKAARPPATEPAPAPAPASTPAPGSSDSQPH
jgi:hypothetical protein